VFYLRSIKSKLGEGTVRLALMATFGLGAIFSFPSLVVADGSPGNGPEVQIPILLKILTFDRALELRANQDLLIVVVEGTDDSTSHLVAERIAEELARYNGQTVWGRHLRTELRSFDELMTRFDSDVDVLYLAPGLERSLQEILKWSRQTNSFTFTSAPRLHSKGVAVWLGGTLSAPRILINLAQVRAEGRELDARLLSLATVVR